MPMASSPSLFLMTCLCVAFVDANNTISSNWQRHDNLNVTGYEMMTSAASPVSCVVKCRKHSHCDSCAHDGESRRCYLQVQTEATAEPQETSVRVFKAHQFCLEGDAPINTISTHVTWQRSGWHVQGAVTCNDDYMYVGVSPTVHCWGPDSTWTPAGGQCLQHRWRNPQYALIGKFPLPTSPGVNWKVCLSGMTTVSTDRLGMNYYKDANNILFHVDVRLNFNGHVNKFIMNAMENWNWFTKTEVNLDPFPVQVGQEFKVRVTATSETDIQVSFGDSSEAYSYTATRSLSGVQWITVHGIDVDVDVLDIWC